MTGASSLHAALFALALAVGAAPDIALTPQKPVARSIDAYPRIASPSTAETATINETLAKADARVKNAARDCNQTDAFNADQWRRAVAVPFRYGDFLTLSADDNWACATFSGAFVTAVTYDLTTGAPVDWASLFPPRIAGDPGEGVAGDTTRLSLVVSPILNEVYRRKVLISMDTESRGACADAFKSYSTLMLWLDAEQAGVMMRGVGFPRGAAPCAAPVLLTMDELGQLKAQPRLIDALKAAHAAHAWSADIRPGPRPRPGTSR